MMAVDQDAVSRHIHHLDAVFKSSPLAWEIATFAAVEALHVVAVRYDREFAAKLFRDIAASYAAKPSPDDRIAPARLERIETIAGILSPERWNRANLGENPPTDPYIVSVCDMVGRGWQKGRRFHLSGTDITDDIRRLFDQLDKLNAPRGEFDDEPEIDRDAVREVGYRLYDLGGVDAMLAAAEVLRPMVGNVLSRLGWAWDGIGRWRW